jgi:hypothetical protein
MLLLYYRLYLTQEFLTLFFTAANQSLIARKQLLTSTPTDIIVYQSPSVGEPMHDFQAFKDDHEQRGILNEFAEVRATFYGDSGFQGMQKMKLPVEVRLQERGKHNHPLTRDQKKINALRSSL